MTGLALISVSDKSGLDVLGPGLERLGWRLLSTGGTARALRDAGCDVIEVGDHTGFPEILDLSTYGITEIYWSEPFPTGQEGAVSVDIEYDVGIVEATPVSIEFDLSDVVSSMSPLDNVRRSCGSPFSSMTQFGAMPTLF